MAADVCCKATPPVSFAALCAGVAQLVEQRIRNAKVTSSIPVIGTNKIKHLSHSSEWLFCFLGFM